MDRGFCGKITLGLLIWAAYGAPHALAQCLGLSKGAVVIDVKTCKVVVPKEDFNRDFDFTFIKGLTAPDRAKFFANYRGLVINGLVVKSLAKKTGFDEKKGALAGETIKAFISGTTLTCEAIKAKRLDAVVDEHCCSGSADAPCLLGTTYQINNRKVTGAAGSSTGDKERQAAESSPEYKEALTAFNKKQYKEAAQLLEKVPKLDLRGHFLLGLTYRNLDECKKAITPLQNVFDRAAKKDTWADQAAIVRRSNFLLARCYAKVNDPGRATIILSGYLIETKKYAAEIRESLRHPDFGFINASKEYGDYRISARKALSNPR